MDDFEIDGLSFCNFLDSLAKNKKVSTIRFKANGISMTPFIRGGDTIVIKFIGTNDIIKKGDVVVAKQTRGNIIIHRVIQIKKDLYRLKGDNKRFYDGWFHRKLILGTITEVRRASGRQIYYGRWQKHIIAFLSQTGLLNFFVLPLGRRVKQKIPKWIHYD